MRKAECTFSSWWRIDVQKYIFPFAMHNSIDNSGFFNGEGFNTYFCPMENRIDESGASAEKLSFDRFREEVLQDYRWVCLSREVSVLGRKEVLTGKAKFGIFGDGKEVAQVAMAKFFEQGDFRSGYYRDQTFMFASGLLSVEQFFAQLYADPNLEHEPFSGGRQMNAHFASRWVNTNGEWLDLANRKNISSDIAPTAGQMPRGLGLAFASKCFRLEKGLDQFSSLSNKGNEVCFCTIGDASTSEGHFWETMNAAGVLQVPLAMFVWDDGYGISVPKKYQTTKASISEALKGFQKEEGTNGFNIYKVKGWDYAGMCEAFEEGIRLARETHTPALFHVEEITQPQGHSTSGSHERYKNANRLEWERTWDGMIKMREWIIENALATEEELESVELDVKEQVREGKRNAWTAYLEPIKTQVTKAAELLTDGASKIPAKRDALDSLAKELTALREPLRRDVMKALHTAVQLIGKEDTGFWIKDYFNDLKKESASLFNTFLYNEGEKSALKVPVVTAQYSNDAPTLNG
ncbi:MAG TPA: thiamine pyrophosphate-dependent dehydrogenase E1 component subunit alpha, partial [Chitinophagaceae bacterium]|nr:thiamine pyrophosphate-dependent dehydrogenase E1 component subunit alpha [Chitinophagaceae bacterium]